VYGCDHFVERRWQLGQIGEPDWVNSIDPDGNEQIGLTIHGSGYRSNEAHEGRDITDHADVATRYQPDDAATSVEDGLDVMWFKRSDAARLQTFAARKQHLPDKCLECNWKAFCHGGCPEHRPQGGDEPEASVLCEGYIYFYEHAMERLEWLAGYLRRGQQPPAVQRNVQAGAATDSAVGKRMPVPAGAKVGRNDPCPCGSGVKYKHCCGR